MTLNPLWIPELEGFLCLLRTTSTPWKEKEKSKAMHGGVCLAIPYLKVCFHLVDLPSRKLIDGRAGFLRGFVELCTSQYIQVVRVQTVIKA